MDDQDRAEILSEILRERLRTVRYTIDEWSVAEADALNYAQAKDLIWQLAAPLGLSTLGFSAAGRALRENPGDPDLASGQAQFAQVGEDVGKLMEYFLALAARVRH